MMLYRRQGFTLIELLLVIAIIAVLIGLLLVAVQKARMAAVRLEGANNQRQIILASHAFAEVHGGIPSIDGNPTSPNSGKAYLYALLPFIEGGNLYRELNDPLSKLDKSKIQVKTYYNPMDPSIPYQHPTKININLQCSYALNGQAFHGAPSLEATFRDGTSNTIAIAERYWWCGGPVIVWTQRNPDPAVGFILPPVFASPDPLFKANGGANYPITEGDPPVSRGRYPATFQAAPKPGYPQVGTTMTPVSDFCHHGSAQTPNPSGMTVAMADGSVRLLARDIAPSVYWGLVTPAGGEVFSDN